MPRLRLQYSVLNTDLSLQKVATSDINERMMYDIHSDKRTLYNLGGYSTST